MLILIPPSMRRRKQGAIRISVNLRDRVWQQFSIAADVIGSL
jgi:hypothetical protein